MIPLTRNQLPALLCISAMQKCIRRAMEVEAMQFACELVHTSKQFNSMVCNRLEIICHEDIDTLQTPWIVPFVHTCCVQAREFYNPKRLGKSRMPIGNAIRMMCQAPKSRIGDHFQAAIGLSNLLENTVPEVPDFAYDKHTQQGKRMGRGLEHFRTEGTILVPPSTTPDPYEEWAFRLWALKEQRSLLPDDDEV